MDHTIDQHVSVYLSAGGHGWEIDPLCINDRPLAGYVSAFNDGCECGDPVGCEAARADADLLDPPTAAALALLLVDAVLTFPGATDADNFCADLDAVLHDHGRR
ncbi:hypothetical protein [Amycolatopsis jejuensis]|uniref:hypothetical protein n=1 Tax=Amycolatopsis jejuensis TaxID=330084 RepID=UPI00068CD7BD|nr:hypothetical protein [Amycolatopsis jejuensis]